ncbi:MAG: hypothetical protein JNK82_38225 [Myxococcaceae bacterium]|nr:hypothetical protein [Myxococcaceae bacterium]
MRRLFLLSTLLPVFVACRCQERIVQTCTEEVCDGVDNDCDEQIDEDLADIVCGTGVCKMTVSACIDGKAPACVAGTPSAETCNQLDDDCNGLVDDGMGVIRCGIGACARELATCTDGMTPACVPGTPISETCNNKDDDCDGEVDEGLLGESCGVGACRRSINLCGGVGICTPGEPTTEICNGIDDDCDGVTDEGNCMPPVVMCPGSQVARVGTTAMLNGTVVSSNGAVTTRWVVQTAPAGSTAMVGGTAPMGTFTPDVAGDYTLRFCARDAMNVETCCTVALTSSNCMTPPSPPAGTACGTSWDGRPIVTFPAVAAGVVYDLVDAAGTRLASAPAGANWLRPATRIAAGGPVPGAPVSLGVRACLANDMACCSMPTALTVNVVEACTTPQMPTTTNIVFSEYVVNGEGSCASMNCFQCQAGEAIEITNLSNCPVTLSGTHFKYRNNNAAPGSLRWMNFGAADIIPPRGVYVAIRGRNFAPNCSAPLPAESSALYGLKISTLAMEGDNLCSGWFNNTGGGQSEMQIARGTVMDDGDLVFTPANALARIAPYQTGSMSCVSTGFDAVDSCGSVVASSMPTATLTPNQLGRLWHPCDAVVGATPTCPRN